MSPILLTPKRAARYLGVSVTTFNKWRSDDKSPRLPQPIQTRGVRMFVLPELESFVRECIAERSAK